MAANKRESRAFSIMDTDSALAGGLLGTRANMSSSDDPEFDNQRISMFARYIARFYYIAIIYYNIIILLFIVYIILPFYSHITGTRRYVYV